MRYLLSLLVLSTVAWSATAGPIATAANGGVVVTFYTEKCQLKEVVNLPLRAVWSENGKDVEGCYLARPDANLVVLYFADKTVGIVPFQLLKGVKET